MDPVTAIGLVATVAQLISSTTQVIGFINDARHATKESIQFAQEAYHILGLLLQLRSHVEDPQTPRAWYLGVTPLTSYLDSLDKLLNELAMKLLPLSKTQKYTQKLFWTKNKKEVIELLGKIERLKTLIGLAVEGNLLYSYPTRAYPLLKTKWI
jgi:hypothetical protein